MATPKQRIEEIRRVKFSIAAKEPNPMNTLAGIKRIYPYQSKWEPTAEENPMKIWIPGEANWVGSDECILHDTDDVFGQQFYVLEKYYVKNLLSFFSSTLGVKTYPSFDDYCKLWMDWEDSGHSLSNDECVSFWRFVANAKNWGRSVLCFRRIPALSSSDKRIHLVEKCNVFIGDDLCLKELFEQSSCLPLFVWYPQPSVQSLPRNKLLDIYQSIGVRNLSESVTMRKEESVLDGVGLSGEVFMRKGLFKLILGFLANLQVEANERQDAVKGLLGISVIETQAPITVGYSLSLDSGEDVSVDARRLVRWEKEKRQFFMPKVDWSGGRKEVLECGMYFGNVVSEGLLWDKGDGCIEELGELIKMGFVLEFDEEAVGFLMKTKNLQVFFEDEEFLASVFPSS